MLTLYGIKNCDTVKKARAWLESHGVDYQFHDLRQDGLTKTELGRWLKQLGRDTLINKRSTTWRNLSEQDKTINSDAQAIKLLLAQPTLIKRPVLENKQQILVGFNPKDYAQLS